MPVSESKKALPEVVEADVEAHTYKHRHVFLELLRPRQNGEDQRLGDTVSEQVADCDIDYKSHGAAGHIAFVFKCIILVEKETQDAADDVVGSRRHPVRAAGEVVKSEHYSGADDRIDYPDDYETSQFFVNIFNSHINSLEVSLCS